MPQDKKLTNKDYISGKGKYEDKFTGTVDEYTPDGTLFTNKRDNRIDSAGRVAQRDMKESYAINKRGPIGMMKQLSNSLSAAKNAEKVALAKGMKTEDAMAYGSKAAKNSRPNLSKVPPAKPVSAKTGAKMVAAMAGKAPASPMRKLLKIK
jgi:hypothetical protein